MRNKEKQPLISVVMPVYNAGSFLMEAIESIRAQTYKNWELVCVDDGSSDDSYEILRKYARKDKRIRVYKNRENMGVSATSNHALSKSKGDFIARMDADDISMPWRFEKQIKCLLLRPDVVAVGGQCELIDGEGNIIGEKRFPVSFEDVKRMIFWSIPVQQPSLMINRVKLPDDFVWYDGGFGSAEEVELLFRFFKLGKVVNLPETLLKYRLHGGNLSLINPRKTFYLTLKSRIRAIGKYGYVPSVYGVFLTLIQIGVVTIVPNKYIYPLYSVLRGMNARNVSEGFVGQKLRTISIRG